MSRVALVYCVFAVVLAGCGGKSTSAGGNAGLSPSAPVEQPLHCNAPATPTVLYQGGVSGLTISGDQAIFVDGTVSRVPLGGGSPTQIATLGGAYGLVATPTFAYFTATEAAGAPDASGKQSGSASALYMVPLAGGDPVKISDQYFAPIAAADDTSVYFAGLSGITRFSPPDATPTTSPLDVKLMVRALAVGGSYVYAAVEDFVSADVSTGGIMRIPKAGGTAERLLTLAGLPNDITVDDRAIYWTEDPPYGTFGDGFIRRAGLDGTGVTTLEHVSASAIALDAGHLYFITDGVNRVPKEGGASEELAGGLSGAGLFCVSGADAVWVDRAVKALSDPSPSSIMAVCVGGH